MNRRGFFKALAATALVAVATQTRVGQFTLSVTDRGSAYAEALARSLIETKEMLCSNLLNKAFES